jgi:hypothetical protein
MNDFSIHKVHDGWIVKRNNGQPQQHSHFTSKTGCVKLIRLLNKGLMPKSDYLKTSAQRILTDEEYAMLRTKEHQSYYNRNAKQFGRRTG